MSNPDYTGQSAELVPQAMRGYRFWRFMLKRNELYGQRGGVWPIREPYNATCRIMPTLDFNKVKHEDFVEETYNRHNAPYEDCSCGIYARYFLDHYVSSNPPFGDYEDHILYGSVKATGKTLLGTKGFRSATMEIEAFVNIHSDLLSDEENEFLDIIAHSYGVRMYHIYEEFIEDYPPVDLSALGIEVKVKQTHPYIDRVWTGHISPSTTITGRYTRQQTVRGRRGGQDELYREWLSINVNNSQTQQGCKCDRCHSIRREIVENISSQHKPQIVTINEDLEKLRQDQVKLSYDAYVAGVYQWSDSGQNTSITFNSEAISESHRLRMEMLAAMPQLDQKRISRDLMGGGA